MSPPPAVRVSLLSVLLLSWLSGLPPLFAQPPDATWSTNAELENARALTMEGLGAMQGASFHDDKVYLYGDVWDAKPRVGVIREYTKDYKPTGRVLRLRKGDQPLIRHPTGLTWHAALGHLPGRHGQA